MKLRLSRHARHHLKLYGIHVKEILEAIESPDADPDAKEVESNKRTAIKRIAGRFSGYPLKVVYERTEDEVFVITVYPLKKKPGR